MYLNLCCFGFTSVKQNLVIHTILSLRPTICLFSDARILVLRTFSGQLTFQPIHLLGLSGYFMSFLFGHCHWRKKSFLMRCAQTNTDTLKRKSFVPFEVYHSILVKLRASNDCMAATYLLHCNLLLLPSLADPIFFSSSFHTFFMCATIENTTYTYTLNGEKAHNSHETLLHSRKNNIKCVSVCVCVLCMCLCLGCIICVSVNDVFKVFALNAIKL